MHRTLRTCFLLMGLPAVMPVLSGLGLAGLALAGLGCEAKTTQATGCMKDGDCGTGRICDETGRCIAEPKKVNVLISKVGDGEGTVTSTPAGLDCGATCTAAFYVGRPVTLTATPASGSSVAGFSISCSSTTSTCQFTPADATEDLQVLVNFGRGGPQVSAPLCTAGGVCWENPRPQGNRLNDVHLVGSDVWAVGEGGMVVRRSGGTLSLAPTGGTQNLRGVGGTGTSLFVVGDGGAVLRWGGTAWQSESSGVFVDLYDVWANDTTAVAVGTGGTIVRRSGTSWQTQTSGVAATRTLRGVVMLSSGTGYAVGDAATAVYWNGTAWSSVTNPVLNNHDLRAVTATDGNYPVFAVASSGEIYRLTSAAATWEQVYTTNTIDFMGTAASALGSFAVGREVGGTIMRSSNGTSWTRDIFGYQTEFTSVATTATEAWAVGDAGTMLRYDGTPWTPLSSGRTAALRAISAADNTTAWAVGQTGTILRYSADTRSWSPSTLPGTTPPTMNSVAAVSANEAYAVGTGGAVYKWNGTAWGALTSGTGSDLFAVCATGSGSAVAVGAGGLVLRIQGTSVTSASGGTTNTLRALWCPSATDVWAAGDSGVVVRNTGGGFATFGSQPGTTSSIGGIWGTGATSFWLAAGADLFQFTGAGYTKHTPGVTGLRALWGGSASDVYAVGDKGAVVRWSGGPSWTRVDSGSSQSLYGVTGSIGSVWFAGDGGTVLSRSR